MFVNRIFPITGKTNRVGLSFLVPLSSLEELEGLRLASFVAPWFLVELRVFDLGRFNAVERSISAIFEFSIKLLVKRIKRLSDVAIEIT